MASHPVASARSASLRSRFLIGAGGKLAELATVFAGVYAAFLLNSYELHQEARQRREQILVWLDKTYSEQTVELKRATALIRKTADDFNRQVAEGAMPRLRMFSWLSDYDPADVSGLLQGGGFDLLEVSTIHSLKDVDGTLRQLVAVLRHHQELSDALILPNADADAAVFYDPTTKRLLRKYEWYAEYFEQEAGLFGDLQTETDKLVAQIHAERARNR